MTRSLSVAAALVAAILPLPACGGSDPEPADVVQEAISADLEVHGDSSGPATDPIDSPGGIPAEIVSVTAEPAEEWVSREDPGLDTWVTVTVRLSGSYELDPAYIGGDLLYGPNQIEAKWYASDQDVPTRITPDAPYEVIQEFALPSDGLEELTYVYSPARTTEPNHTFEDVETLLP